MSQSRLSEFDHPGELDPLLAFDAELAGAESAPKPIDPAPAAAAPKADDALALRLRLDQAERSLDRAQSEIAALKSNLATLVSAVDEIKKRLSRRPEVVAAPRPVPVPRRGGLLKVAMVLIVCVTIGAAMWWLAPEMLLDAPEPPTATSVGKPAESESAPAPPVPVPAAAVPASAVERQTVAADRPVQHVEVRQPPRQGAYVGTLSIDAAPAGEVFIDRQVAGRTPLRTENLRAGSHLIWIDRDGYRRWTRVVSVAADRVTRVSATLDPLSR